MLGHKLVQGLSPNFEVWTSIRTDFDSVRRLGIFDPARTFDNLDVTDESAVREAIRTIAPDVVINAVGVIKQLLTSKDVITTLTVNSIVPQRLAQLSQQFDFRLICVSTDCVFLGDRGNYTEDDAADALDLYGRSKYFGEVSGENCLTLRTSIIGREIATANSLVEWFLGNRGRSVNGFINAIYSGFPTIVLADIISDLILNHQALNGLYHVSSEAINKFELLNLINDAFDAKVEISRFDDFYIDRSLNSNRFSNTTGFRPRSWPEMIREMADDQTPYEQWRKTKL